ncbi:DUF4168 domain-containing protein [Chlorogloeopsis sp. ULAP01]|uniref:DUF4168 domain-containing protein n=1 Tax=Chlorogloeopsis sp. ULAP01 TaxID=3056483 RepID=UPI0025AABE5F|nr:DUF4168 domain-containing protein [Chlorogloeopsis sp. ULAP01]MDM9381186.1 DUF4168 domain-containing protein [Chlorogloeopsis sp. ULAP01]
MNRSDCLFRKSSLAKIIFHSLLVSSLSIVSWVTTMFVWNTKVDAQSPSQTIPADKNPEIMGYSRALIKIESARQQAFENIKKIIGNREVPKMACNDPNSLNNIPSEARDIAVNYCNRSQEIVKENGLTPEQFNKITVELQNNEDLKRQIYNTLIHLQKNPNEK